MKINYKNQDLKIIKRSSDKCRCCSCVWYSTSHLHWCRLVCRSGIIWMKDIFNSDIFKL